MTEETTISIDAVMEQAQVFASAWALVDGPFDNGNALENAEEAKVEVKAMELLDANGSKFLQIGQEAK